MIKAAEFMVSHGMNADRIDLDLYSKMCCEYMQRGLAEKTDIVPMIPTYLRGDAQVPKNKKVAVIDAGGTNFRTALVSFTKEGVCFENLQKHSMPGTTEPASWDEFISHTADCVEPLMAETEEIGFCFSYPAEVTKDIDSRVLSLTKQVKIEGAEGKLLGADLKKALEGRGVKVSKIVVLNDTPATLLGGSAQLNKSKYGGFIGMVAGTGVNCCCMVPDKAVSKLGLDGEKRMLINLESGSFDGFFRGDFDIEMDEALADTGHYIGEKLCSGAYLGELCLRTLKAAANEGVFSEKGRDFILGLEFMHSATADKWGTGKLPKGLCGEDGVNAVYIICELFERAARCMACVLCGILLLTGEGEGKPVCICVDGSMFNKSKLFRPALEDCMAIYAGEIMERKYEFVTGEELSLLGSAAAVLLN